MSNALPNHCAWSGDNSRKLLQRIRADGDELITSLDGTLILVEDDVAWIAPFPELRSGNGETRSDTFWRRAYAVSYAKLLEEAQSTDLPRLILTDEKLPEIWHIDAAYFSNTDALPIDCCYTSSQLKKWAQQRDKSYSDIEPIVDGWSLSELLRDKKLTKRASQHAIDAGLNYTRVLSLVNRYIHAGANKRGLFPRTYLCGGRGKSKVFTNPSGRPTKAFASGESDIRGFVCTKLDRANCELGWKLFMMPGRTIDEAYASFIRKFYSQEIRYIGPGRMEAVLLPPGKYPSINQFKNFGQKKDPLRSPALMNISSRIRRNNVDGHGGNARSQYKLALQAGLIDSTSDDQGSLCSVASPLLMLQSTWTTRIVCAATSYIFGEYTSFERVSARTHMAAILHAATPKVQWAKSVGFDLKEGDWHHGTFKSTVSDNGEGKCLENIAAHTSAEMEAVYTPTFISRSRSIIENTHYLSHLFVDWRTTGSTFGKLRNRGEKLNTDSPYDFTEHLRRKIAGVLHINNVERVEHLLTIEMRRQGVEPTRRGIFEYMKETGQVADGPASLLAFLPTTLPRIHARITRSGILIWDPREPVGHRYVPNLTYWSPWLAETGLLTASRWRTNDILVSIDPMFIGKIYVEHEKVWKEVLLQSNDLEKSRLTLVDWIAITDTDQTKRFLSAHTVLQSKASMSVSTELIENQGAARKDSALRSGERAPKGRNKRQLTKEEIARLNLQSLGFKEGKATTRDSADPSPQQTQATASEDGSVERLGELSNLPTWMTDGVRFEPKA